MRTQLRDDELERPPITDSAFCTLLGDTLDVAQDLIAVNNYWGVRDALDSIYVESLDPPGEPELHDNAFWMLFVNTDDVYDNLTPPDAVPGASTLCAHGPSETTAYFTVTSAATASWSRHRVAEAPGVDSEGSSCGEIWDFPLRGTELVDV